MASWELFAGLFGRNYTLFIAVVAHFNVFLACMSYAWPSPVLPKLFEPENNPLGNPITAEQGDMIAAIFYVGAATGPILFYGIVEKVGRRKVLIFVSFFPPILFGILAFADTVLLYNICRVLLGLGVGVMFSVEPVYVSEILADDERPFLMSIMTIFAFSGIFLAMLVGPFVPLSVFHGMIALVSLLIALLTAFGFPETPYFLLKKKGEQATRELLQKLRKGDVENEVKEISETVASEFSSSCWQVFSSLKNIKAFLLSTLPLLMQSYSGIALILNYSQLIFMKTNVAIPAEWCAIIVLGFTLSTTFLTPLFMNKGVSIHTLMIYCLGGVAICDFIMGMYFKFGLEDAAYGWVPLVTLVLFVLIYNCGLDPIPWMLMGETYPLNIRSVGTALSTSIFELSVFPSLFFFSMIDPSHLFLFSSGCCMFGVIFFKFFTDHDGKNKDSHEMKTIA